MVVVDNKKAEDVDAVVMADDGKGSSISIPTWLIGYDDGMALKEAIHKKVAPKVGKSGQSISPHQKVIIQAEINMVEKSTNLIDVDLWYGSIYELAMSRIDLRAYAKMSEIFHQHVNFLPRVMLKSCSTCNKIHKVERCINDGQYCPILPDKNKFQADTDFLKYITEGKLDPRKIIIQSLREQCVHHAMNP